MKLLQKCAYAMISQQELQGASYLLEYEDHFTSHSYRNFYWTSFETPQDLVISPFADDDTSIYDILI